MAAEVGSTLMEKRPLVSIDMNTLATCTSTDPNTCFDTSKNQIFIGLCGLSRHLLYTRDMRARPPSASCTKSAKGPNRRHSPWSSPPFPPTAIIAVGVGAMLVVVVVCVMLSSPSTPTVVDNGVFGAVAMANAADDVRCWRSTSSRTTWLIAACASVSI